MSPVRLRSLACFLALAMFGCNSPTSTNQTQNLATVAPDPVTSVLPIGQWGGNDIQLDIVNNGGGSYTLTTLVSFNGTNGVNPTGSLIADAAGDLFGTTTGTSAITNLSVTDGTAFELSGAGFVAPVPFAVYDATTNVQSTSPGTPYSGPVYGLVDQYINTTAPATDTLDVAAGVPNTFIRVGSQGGNGEAAIDVSHVGGINVLDGEYGSDFLVGGTGPFSFDTFFVEDAAFSEESSLGFIPVMDEVRDGKQVDVRKTVVELG